jgi:hypothetical protein
MDATQLRCPKKVHSGPKHEFFIFLGSKVSEMVDHSQTSFWVNKIRMDASQLRYLEIVHSGSKHNYFIFLCAEG